MRTYILRCLDDTRRIQALLDPLRTFSLFDVSARDRLDLREFLEAELPAIQDGLDKQGIRFACSIPAHNQPLEASCDPRGLYQILLGLIANANEAIAGRGRSGHVRLDLFRSERDLCIAVSDDGPGIEPENLDKVILPLFTTKSGGTGLGLAIAHEMLTRMGGRLEIGSDPALGGARVVIRLRGTTDPVPAKDFPQGLQPDA